MRRRTMEDIFEEVDNIIQHMLGSGFGPAEHMEKPLVWGFSMTRRGNEPPEIREFGNVDLKRVAQPNTDVRMEPDVRKPLIDIMEAEDTLHVIVEMPGVTREDITLNGSSTSLDIKAEHEDRKYSEHVELPAKVLPDSAKATYRNGVLEVIFQYDRSDKRSIKIK